METGSPKGSTGNPDARPPDWPADDILDHARKVLEVEARSVARLEQSLDEEFISAVDAIFRCRGKLLATGMGKSGMVARKAASTFSSVGLPCVFLHAADALHGDLGVIGSDDVVIAISYSGETQEVLTVVRSAVSLGARTIALVGNTKSTLAATSDTVLDVRVECEACHLNLAPTASTIAALAMADALAMVVSRIRGVSPEEFARYHPAGSLGKMLLLRVDDIMHVGEANPVVRHNVLMSEAVLVMTEKGLGAVTIVGDDGKLAGILTDGDLRRAIQRFPRDLLEMPVGRLMATNPITVQAGTKALDALAAMELGERLIHVLPVLDKGHVPIGLLRLHDLVQNGLPLGSSRT